MLLVEHGPTTNVGGHRRCPLSPSTVHFVLRNVEIKSASDRIESDDVSITHEGKWSTDGSLRRSVQNTRTERRTTHARVCDAHHVAHASGS